MFLITPNEVLNDVMFHKTKIFFVNHPTKVYLTKHRFTYFQ